MILIINICREKLHFYELVKPICYILEINEIKYLVKNYKEVYENDLKIAEKIIICGTSLYDNEFIKNMDKFKWIIDFEKPVLGVCGGMQIIGKVFGGKLKKKTEIGFYTENFKKDFLGLNGKQEVYHLHNYYVSLPKNFVNYTNSKFIQAIKHKEKEIYGALFHPEVRNKNIILEFCKI